LGAWTSFVAGLRGLFGKDSRERELEDELRDYLDHAAEQRMRSGMAVDVARRAARLEMGGVEEIKERLRAGLWETWVENLWGDLRFGARLLRRNPGFASAAMLSLALGIGANTAIFQLLDAVRLRSLPVRNPLEIARVAFATHGSRSGHFSSRYPDFTNRIWQEIRDRQQGFSSVFAWSQSPFNVSPAGEVRNIQGLWVSGEFFPTLGVTPALGRLLGVEDDQPACNSPGAILSYAYWQEEYGGRKDVLGKPLTINRHPLPILGVASPDFYGVEVGRSFDVALPLCAEPAVNGESSQLKSDIGWWLSVMGRLKPGASVESAASQLKAISRSVFEAALPSEYNPSNRASLLAASLTAVPGNLGVSDLRDSYEQPLWLLLALAGLVLLIASANLANLMLARASAREKEMGMRMAIGAGRSRLLRQLLTESLLLAALGASLGALLARELSAILILSLSTQENPLFVDLHTDWRVLGFTTALAVSTCILFGLAPALRATRVAPSMVIKEAGGGSDVRVTRLGFRQILVVSQVALSLTLLVGALLFSRSLNNLARLDPGFRREGILVADIDFSARHLPEASRWAFSEELLRAVRGIPGVEAASGASITPLSGDGIGHEILLGDLGQAQGNLPGLAFNYVTPGYFETLQTPLLRGRDFNEHDRIGSPNVAIVNEAFVRKFGGGKDPLDVQFRVRRLKNLSEPYLVIGVVKNSKYGDLREQPQPIAYTAKAQSDRPPSHALLLIRSRVPLANLLADVKRTVKQEDSSADIVFTNFGKMIDDGLLRDRMMARLSGFFGVLATILALIGLYGVISYGVARRRREIGIRMALGATRREVLALVLRGAAPLISLGLAIGVALALALGRAAAFMLFDLEPYDFASLLLAVLSLSGGALLASYLPASRASRLDPMVALRHE